MTIVGMPKSSRPKFEDPTHRGKMLELPPIELCTDRAWYPYVGEKCDLVAHPFGRAKEKVRRDIYDRPATPPTYLTPPCPSSR
jgi:hypothetical protein